MSSKRELDLTYLKVAQLHADLSKALRSKVGACLVTSTGVIVPGYNGTVGGADNACENRLNGFLVTKPSVLHAELNCILKCSKEGITSEGSTLYLTLSPCEACAAMIAQAGIKRVVYTEKYRDKAGLHALDEYNVESEQIKVSV